jgi:hypothetical protein
LVKPAFLHSDWLKGYARVYLKTAVLPFLITLQFPSIWITDCAKFSLFRHFSKYGLLFNTSPYQTNGRIR